MIKKLKVISVNCVVFRIDILKKLCSDTFSGFHIPAVNFSKSNFFVKCKCTLMSLVNIVYKLVLFSYMIC